MKLLGKDLAEWGQCPDWRIECDRVWFRNISWNRDVFLARYNDGDYFGTVRDLVMEGNTFRETRDIIRHIHAAVYLDLFTEAEWLPMIPIVEQALQFNIDYVKCLHDVEPHFRALYDRYGYAAGYTLKERMSLEFWQGLFAFDRSGMYGERKPNYT